MAFIPPLLAMAGPALASGIGSMFAGAGAASAAGAATASLGLGAAATGLSTAGGILGAVQGYQSNMFQSQIATYNEQLAEQNKTASLSAGINAEEIKKMQTAKLVGSEIAGEAVGNTDVRGGSNQQVRQATQTAGDFDALTIRYNAARQAYGYSQEAFSDMLQAQSSKESAYSALAGGLMKAGGNFLSSASSLADKSLQYQLSGALQVPVSNPGATTTEVPF